MSTNFNAQTDQKVADAKAAINPGNGSTPTPKDSVGGAIGTSAGGEIISPAGATAESLGAAYTNKHGKIYAKLATDRSSQGNQALEVVASAQEDARIGGTGPFVGSNGVGNQTIPYTVTNTTWVSTVASGEAHSITGTSYAGSGTIPAISLTNPNLLSIVSVTGAGHVFPASSVGTSGAGYVIVGDTIAFTNGGYATFSGASAAFKIPASGANSFYVNYTYNVGTTTSTGYGNATSENYTMPDNNGVSQAFIPNVGNRFAR